MCGDRGSSLGAWLTFRRDGFLRSIPTGGERRADGVVGSLSSCAGDCARCNRMISADDITFRKGGRAIGDDELMVGLVTLVLKSGMLYCALVGGAVCQMKTVPSAATVTSLVLVGVLCSMELLPIKAMSVTPSV